MDAVIVGKVALPQSKPVAAKSAPARQERPRSSKRNNPQSAVEGNKMQLQELQYLKAQIKSLRQDLDGYDSLRAAVAVLESSCKGTDVKASQAAVDQVLKVFKDL